MPGSPGCAAEVPTGFATIARRTTAPRVKRARRTAPVPRQQRSFDLRVMSTQPERGVLAEFGASVALACVPSNPTARQGSRPSDPPPRWERARGTSMGDRVNTRPVTPRPSRSPPPSTPAPPTSPGQPRSSHLLGGARTTWRRVRRWPWGAVHVLMCLAALMSVVVVVPDDETGARTGRARVLATPASAAEAGRAASTWEAVMSLTVRPGARLTRPWTDRAGRQVLAAR